MEALTVACCNVGDYLGRGKQYVETLASMCQRHLPPHEFVCITESPHAGYWCKLSLFEPGRFTGNVLYLDLDVVISGDLAHLVSLLDAHDFWILDDFCWPFSRATLTEMKFSGFAYQAGPQQLYRQLGGWGTCNSSVMLWRDEAGREIWDRYSPEAADGLHGDQNWITRVMAQRLRLIPHGWAGSFKLGPYGCPITVMHGDPKPHELPEHRLIAEHWR